MSTYVCVFACVCTCLCVFRDSMCVCLQIFFLAQQQVFLILQVCEFGGPDFCGTRGGADTSVFLDALLRSVCVWTLSIVCVCHDFWIITVITLLYEELAARSVFLLMSLCCGLLLQDLLKVTQIPQHRAPSCELLHVLFFMVFVFT